MISDRNVCFVCLMALKQLHSNWQPAGSGACKLCELQLPDTLMQWAIDESCLRMGVTATPAHASDNDV